MTTFVLQQVPLLDPWKADGFSALGQCAKCAKLEATQRWQM